MLLTEYNEARQMELVKEEGRAEGRREGRAEGESRFALLMSRLFALGRGEDAVRAANDSDYRQALYEEFGQSNP